MSLPHRYALKLYRATIAAPPLMNIGLRDYAADADNIFSLTPHTPPPAAEALIFSAVIVAFTLPHKYSRCRLYAITTSSSIRVTPPSTSLLRPIFVDNIRRHTPTLPPPSLRVYELPATSPYVITASVAAITPYADCLRRHFATCHTPFDITPTVSRRSQGGACAEAPLLPPATRALPRHFRALLLLADIS